MLYQIEDDDKDVVHEPVWPDCSIVSREEPPHSSITQRSQPDDVWLWTKYDVGRWISSEGFHVYRPCFEDNCVTGRQLILMDASALPNIGIRDFKHIKEITAKIRKVLFLHEPDWSRSISLPPRDTNGMFLEQKSRTGERSETLELSDFAKNWNELKFRPPLSNHVQILPHD